MRFSGINCIAFFLLGLFFFLPGSVFAESPLSLEETLKWGLENAPSQEELQEELASARRELERIHARYGWQVDLRGSADFDLDDREFGGQLLRMDLSRNLLPGVSIGADLSYREVMEREEEFAELNEGGNDTDFEPDIGFSISYTLFPRTPSTFAREIKEQEKNIARLENSLDRSRGEEVLNWIEDYFDLVGLKESLQKSRQDLERVEEELQEVKRQKEIGEAGEIELLNSEIAEKQSRSSLRSQKQSFDAALEDFYQELNLPGEKDIEMGREADFFGELETWVQDLKIEEMEFEEKLETVFKRNPDLANMELDYAQLQREKEWFAQERLPEVDLTGSGGGWDDDWQGEIGLEFNYTLYDSGQDRMEKEDYQSDLEEMEEEREELKEDLKDRLESLIEEIETARLAREEKTLELKRAELEKDLAREEFEKGIITRRELNEAITEKKDAELALMEAGEEVLLARLQLAHFMGKNYFQREKGGP